MPDTKEFNQDKVDALRIQIDAEFQDFLKNSKKYINKAAARRARKNTLELTKLMKTYRVISIK
jgi:hypothetical protein